MRIVLLNAWGGRLQDRLLSLLPSLGADVLCLEEVVHTPGAPAETLEYRDPEAGTVLPQRARMLGELAAALPDHHASFCPAARGPLWHGAASVPSFWGLATFVRRAIPVIGQAQDFVHGRYGAEGYGAHPRARSAHAVRLFDHEMGRAVTVAHMHGLRDLAGKHDTPERAAQAHRFADLVGGLRRPGEALAACGDLNVRPGSETLRILRERLGARELVTEGGHPGTRTSLYARPERFADYMLVAGAEVRRFEVLTEPEVSDHAALVLDLGRPGAP